MSTIREVAQKANVSVATVSRVINKNGKVTEETKNKVLEIIEELNYVPNSIAVSLNNKKTKTIGLVIPDITNPFFPELAKIVERKANEEGYSVIICNSDNNIELEKKNIAMLEQKYVDGIIIASDTFKYSYLKKEIPIVVIDRSKSSEFSTVVSNNYQGGILASNHLLSIGCKRIAHISGPLNLEVALDRLRGYEDTVKNTDWFNSSYIVSASFDLKSAFLETKLLIKNNNEIDGIFAGNDLMGVGVLKALHSLNKKVPEEVAVIGFDNIAFSEITIPELSTIAQPIHKMGIEAINILFNDIESNKKTITSKILDVELIKRSSTAFL